MDSKKPWQSKTVVLNAVLGVLAAVSVFMPGAQVVSEWIGVHAGEIGMGWAVLNIVLRAVSKDRISLGD